MVGAAESSRGTYPMSAADRRWLIVGHKGMLGTDLLGALEGRDVVGLDLPDLDITDPVQVEDGISGFDVVVNCAAFTAVDAAEEQESVAFAVNAVGPANLARSCGRSGAALLHISTDYVFAGDATEPYPVDAALAPKSAYGRTKAAGEWAVRAEAGNGAWILRTAWLYGAHGPNFVRTMLSLEGSRETVDVVTDQVGQPTWSGDLAARIVAAVDRGVPFGTYHATASGRASWFEFARRIFELAGADPDRVRPTTSAAFVRPAPRPSYSVLDHSAWHAVGLEPMRDWGSALAAAWTDLSGAA